MDTGVNDEPDVVQVSPGHRNRLLENFIAAANSISVSISLIPQPDDSLNQ